MKFNEAVLNSDLNKVIDPYTLGVLCGVITGRDLFLPTNVITLVSLLKSLKNTYQIKLEDEDWYLFVIGVLKSLEVYGFSKDYSVQWICLEPNEILPDETKAILQVETNNETKLLCITFFGKD